MGIESDGLLERGDGLEYTEERHDELTEPKAEAFYTAAFYCRFHIVVIFTYCTYILLRRAKVQSLSMYSIKQQLLPFDASSRDSFSRAAVKSHQYVKKKIKKRRNVLAHG